MIDYQLEDTVFLPFTTRAFATGIPTLLAGTPAIDIYEDATATPIITGETLVVSLNSVIGFNMITVTATAATGFNVGGHYTAVIQAGTVGGVSVVGEVVGEFTIDNSAAAKDLANVTDGLGAIKTETAAILVDVTGINGDVMRGTDSALLAASINLTAGAVDNVTLVTTTTINTDMRGTDGVDTATMRGTDGVDTSDILTQVNAALDTAIGELTQTAPVATPNLRTGLMLLYMALRNRLDVDTSGTDEFQVHNDAGTVIAKKALTDDGADFSEAEMVSGP